VKSSTDWKQIFGGEQKKGEMFHILPPHWNALLHIDGAGPGGNAGGSFLLWRKRKGFQGGGEKAKSISDPKGEKKGSADREDV